MLNKHYFYGLAGKCVLYLFFNTAFSHSWICLQTTWNTSDLQKPILYFIVCTKSPRKILLGDNIHEIHIDFNIHEIHIESNQN
jgi:hypothetical protein